MEYKIIVSDDCDKWLQNLNDKEKVDVIMVIKLLKELGHNLGYPYSSSINGSKHSRMRGLRIQHQGKPYRVLYAFDPARMAILLIGGNKEGDNRWYKKNVPIADRIYDEHLRSLTEENNYDQIIRRCIETN